MRLSKSQQTAYHEAAHAVAFLHVGEPFYFIQLFDCTLRHVDPGTPVARVHHDFAPDQHCSLWRLFVVLAGPAANKHMHPGLAWGAIALGGAGDDYKQALEITAELKDGGRFAEDMARTTMMRFVRKEWDRITLLGNALLNAPERTLSYSECLRVLGLESHDAAIGLEGAYVCRLRTANQ